MIDIWLLDPTGGGWSGQPSGNLVKVIVAFEEALDEGSSRLNLDLQPYVAGLQAYSYLPIDNNYEASPPAATFGMVPMSTAGNWPGASLRLQQQEYHLASYGPSDELLMWAENQVLSESQRGGSFEDAINAFIFALRDTPLQDGRATIMVPANLVRSVCDMVSWIRIWQAPVIYVHGAALGSGLPTVHPLPESVTWELKSQATTAMRRSEHTVLGTLDEMLKETSRVEKLSMWVCLWQLILIYRKAQDTYTEAHLPICDPGRACLDSAATTVKQLYRLLLVKYASYFCSSSPIHHKSNQKPTMDLVAEDPRLRTAWEAVVQRCPEFCKSLMITRPFPQSLRETKCPDFVTHIYWLRFIHWDIAWPLDRKPYPCSLANAIRSDQRISQSIEPLDVTTKVLILGGEARLERRRKKKS